MNNEKNEHLLRIFPDMAEVLDVGRSRAYELVASGQIRAVRLSERCIRVPESELWRYINSLKEEAGFDEGGNIE